MAECIADEDGSAVTIRPKRLPPPWVITFADLMTLLLCFFILLFSMSAVEEDTFKQAASSLRKALTGTKGENAADRPGDGLRAEDFRIEAHVEEELGRICRGVNTHLREKKMEEIVRANVDARGCVITLQSDLMFHSGQAEIAEAAQPMLESIGDLVIKFKYHIRIEGHADNVPIQTIQFPSNWELSSARAIRFAEELIRNGIDPKRLSVEGFGEYRPLVPNISVKNRTKNRRVEIIYKRQMMVAMFRKRLLNPDSGPALPDDSRSRK